MEVLLNSAVSNTFTQFEALNADKNYGTYPDQIGNLVLLIS